VDISATAEIESEAKRSLEVRSMREREEGLG